jgi:cytochrome o ubiquinol oxidase subunit 2
MAKNRQHDNYGRTVGIIFLALGCFAVLIKMMLEGSNVALFNPKGFIARQQLDLMFLIVGIMLIIAIPTLFMLFYTARKYRETNDKPKRGGDKGYGKYFAIGLWMVPATFAVVLALIMWPATHRLEPKKIVAADAKPLTIQVVAQRWKWLFIYPEQKIATVNYVQIPTNTPVTFELTADETPMSSFWIPNLGGMLYAMNGHVNKLNLLADTPGEYPGSSAEINGPGFAGMKFTAKASSAAEFEQWVSSVRLADDVLSEAEYSKLLQPSENNPAALYSSVEDDLYDTIVMKYTGTGAGHNHAPATNEHTNTEHGAHH